MLGLDDTFDENGISLLTLWVSRGAGKVVIEGEVEVTDAEGTDSTGELRLVGRAYGARTRTVTDDGVTRLVVDERGDTQARGDVLGVAFDQPGFEVDTSNLVALATYLPRPVYQPLAYLM